MGMYMFKPNVTKIGDKLFLGNIKAATSEEFLKKENIRCIIEISDPGKSKKHMEGIEYLSLEFKDRNHTDLTPYIEKAIKFIDENHKQNKSVLVHCSAGVSRSPSIVISYLIYTGMSFEEAFKKVRALRSVVDPNYGFRNQLINFQKQLKTQ